jgi:hypothetical protein
MSSLGLLDLANQRFYDLTDPELHFLKSVRSGKKDGIESATLPRRILRCEIIRWLCTNEEAKKLVDPFGIQIDFAELRRYPTTKRNASLISRASFFRFHLSSKIVYCRPESSCSAWNPRFYHSKTRKLVRSKRMCFASKEIFICAEISPPMAS